MIAQKLPQVINETNLAFFVLLIPKKEILVE